MTTQKPHHHRSDRQQDKVVEDTFPASDPPANSGVTGAEAAGADQPTGPTAERGHDARPTGSPTSDRHAMETAHHWEHENTTSPNGKKG